MCRLSSEKLSYESKPTVREKETSSWGGARRGVSLQGRSHFILIAYMDG